jgi:Domain of unknown function (DUF1707)
MTDRIRASDAEREEYATILRAAMSEGRLTLEEGEERLAAVYAAKYRDELPSLTADLPDGGRQALHDTPEAKERRRRDGRRRVGGRFATLTVLAAILTGIWALSGAHFFWPAIILGIVALKMFVCRGLPLHGHHHRQHWASRRSW